MRNSTNYLLLALLLVCALSLWLGRSLSPGEPEEPARDLAPAPGPESGLSASGEVTGPVAESPIHLVVLNGTAEPGLARDVSLAVTLVGCVTERVDNAPHLHFAKTVLINRRLERGAAADLASRLGGVPVIEERDLRTTEDAVLVLGADYARICRALQLTRRG